MAKSFGDSTKSCGNRRSQRTPRPPDLKHNFSKVPPWLNNRQMPDLRVAASVAGMKEPPEYVSTHFEEHAAIEMFGTHECPLQIRICRKLCENGRISDAADALNLRLQQGWHIDANLLYLVLKRCIVHNDLVMGTHIHTLTIKSGYEGDAFLATHLISLYASHRRLEEAMQVFTKVSVPTIYNWTSIIVAYARHGEAAEAIRLYREMIKSSIIKPDNRLYVAVLKACATAGDVVAGREVHSHILTAPRKANLFVQAGLVSMYAKCGSFGDARRVLDKLPESNVVAWNAMFAGYAQQGMGQEALDLYSRMQQEGLTPPNSVTYVCLLQACASVGVRALGQGKQLHAQMEASGLDMTLGGSLVNMYAKCGSLGDARRVFDGLPVRDVVTWTALIGGYAQQGMGLEALGLYSTMQQEGVTVPNSVTYVCLLQACASEGKRALDQGRQLHADLEGQGLGGNLVLGGSLVNMYAKCGSLGDAHRVFDRLPERDVVTWNTLLAGYAQQGMGQEVLSLYSTMQQEGITDPNAVTYVCLLQACSIVGVGALDHGKQLHAEIEERKLQKDSVLGGSLVNMYAKCGSLGDACRVFDRLPERAVVTWTVLIAGYTQQGMVQEALSLYRRMQQECSTAPDSVVYVCLLQACASVGVGAVDQGLQLHTQIKEQGLKEELVLGGSLINMYAKCGRLGDARRVFDRLAEKDVVAWNALLAGYAQEGMGQEVLHLYSQMQQEGLTPNSVTYVCVLQACASVGAGAMDQGKHLHTRIQEQGLEVDLVLSGSLVNMYAKCECLEDARKLFNRLPSKNLVTWNALLAGYAQQGLGQEALSLYSRMQQDFLNPPDSFTYASLLQACASVGTGAVDQGKQLHAEIEEGGLEDDIVLGGSLVNMYAKCGCLELARKVFDRLQVRNVATWNALLAGYSQQGMGEEALSLYSLMQQEGCTAPNSVTFVCLLQACALVASLPLGRQLHAQIEARGLQADVAVGSGLVNMYAKCGSMVHSQQVFDSLPERPMEAWNALASGYARQGDSKVVFALVDRMKLEGMQPDGITFLCLLTVCSHAGQVDKGRTYFKAMTSDYRISPTIEHYACMVDLLGRAGDLEEALWMAKTMPFSPNDVVWRTLLSSCRKWKCVEIGRQTFEFAVAEDGSDDAPSCFDVQPSCQCYDMGGGKANASKATGMWRPEMVD